MVRGRRGRVKNGTRWHPRGLESEATGENPPEMQAFSAGLDRGGPYALAKRYGMSADSIRRRANKHLPPQLRA
jgi:hypothetical protein